MTKKAPFDGMSPEQFFKWLGEQPAEFQLELTKALWKRPQVVVEAAKRLRELAIDPNATPKLREEAKAALKEHGFDDESLRAEDKDE